MFTKLFKIVLIKQDYVNLLIFPWKNIVFNVRLLQFYQFSKLSNSIGELLHTL